MIYGRIFFLASINLSFDQAQVSRAHAHTVRGRERCALHMKDVSSETSEIGYGNGLAFNKTVFSIPLMMHICQYVESPDK